MQHSHGKPGYEMAKKSDAMIVMVVSKAQIRESFMKFAKKNVKILTIYRNLMTWI